MLFEMLSGRPLFEAETQMALLSKHLEEPVPGPVSELCHVSTFVADTIEQLLAKSPSGRPDSARAARLALLNARPKTQYAKNGGLHLAYQLVGTGGVDVVHLPGWVSHLEELWEHIDIARWMHRLASSCRLILTDRRGMGMSDPAPVPTLAERVDDLRAVLDAAGVERSVIFGISEGGPVAIKFAVTHPNRTRGLVLCNSWPRLTYAADWSWGIPAARSEKWISRLVENWGTGASTLTLGPSMAGQVDFVRGMGRLERASATPGQARAMFGELFQLDVRDLLPRVTAPTLIIHRVGDRIAPIEGARFVAARVPGAKLVELPGDDHLFFVGNTEALVSEIERFLRSLPAAPSATQ
jgi:pimeloyl-ACP methyl ester carboxylesterase